MDFDCREGNSLDDIVKRDARETVSRGIDDCAVDVIDVSLEGINQNSLVIGLLDDDLYAQFRCEIADLLIDELQRFQPVNIRFATPEQIGIGTVQHEKSQPAPRAVRMSMVVHA